MQNQTKLMGLQKYKIMQSDGGATHNLTNRKHALIQSKHIPPLPITGIQADNTSLYAAGTGFLPLI